MKKSKARKTRKSSLNQGLLIALIGAVTTILATVIPWALNNIVSVPKPTTTSTAALTPSPESTTPASTTTSTNQIGIFSAHLSYDAKGDFPTESFKPTQAIYLVFDLNDPADEGIVKTVWSVVNVEGLLPGAIIYESTDKVRSSSYVLKLDKQTWVIGEYKVNLYLNGEFDEAIEFKVIP